MDDDARAVLQAAQNDSGIPFQLRVGEELRKSGMSAGLRILVNEHPWQDRDSSEEGYIDFLLEGEAFRAVVEVKRSSEDRWIFTVIDPGGIRMQRSFRALRTSWDSVDDHPSGCVTWKRYRASPETYASPYCEILAKRGKQGKGFTLEGLSRGLIRSLEAHAWENMRIEGPPHYLSWIYVPVIVTNATLVVCFLNPEDVDLEHGAATKCRFEPVGYIRFEKSLVTELPPDAKDIGGAKLLRVEGREKVRSIRASHDFRQRTVFVVNANHIAEFISKLGLHREVD